MQTTWTLSGNVNNGLPGVLAWDGAKLIGSVEAMDAVGELHRRGEVWLTPTGPVMATDPTDPLVAYAMAVDVLQSSDVDGDPPVLPIPSGPPGSVE